ncbi:MAG: efflux RND transporter periplasmic adaptor subunit [Alphaproteobacteria bacterium]
MTASPELKAPRRPLFGTVVAVALLLAGLVAFVTLSNLREAPQGGAAEDRAPLVEVVTAEPSDGPVRVSGTGFVRARDEVTLAARVSGQVVAISPALEPGAAVAQGDVLVTLDRRPFEAALEQARADREAAEADLAFTLQQIERTQSLKSGGFASAERLDDLVSQRGRIRAQLARLDALIRDRTLDLEFTEIKAPFTGRVVTKAVSVGAVVQPGTELGRLYASDVFEIPVPLDTRDAALIPGLWSGDAGGEPGAPTPATVTVRYGTGRYVWQATVVRAEARIDDQSRTLSVLVAVSDPDRPGRPLEDSGQVPPPLRPGMVAEVTIEGRPLPGQILLPRDALRIGARIWIIDGDGRLRIRPVRIISATGERVTVAAPDLAPGTPIITSPLVGAVDGLRVRIPDRETPPAEQPGTGEQS